MDSSDIGDVVRAPSGGTAGYNVTKDQLLEAAGLRLPTAAELRALNSPQPIRQPRPSQPVSVRSPVRARARRTRTAARSRGRPSDDPSEPPSAPLDRERRRGLRILIDRAVRARVAKFRNWRTCPRCLLEQETEEFGNGCSYCRSCESARVSEAYQRRKAVAA